MNMIRILIVCSLFVIGLHAIAEEPIGEIAFRQSLLDLGTDLRLMCVAAHPDDEDGATLAMYRKKYGYKTFAVIATRGEGGQNEIGGALYEELGVIRTAEMQGASTITGAELHFLDLPEFGYSKTLEETMAIWGHDEALGRTVRMIRLCRPDVIISNHGTRVDHGNHQAVGALLREAFDLAGDASAYPEHLEEGLKPWQPARLYLRAWRETGKGVTVDVSEVDPWRGKTYAEIAADALRVHASQGMEFFIRYYLDGRPVVQYMLEKEFVGGVAGAGDLDAPGGVLFRGLKDRVGAEDRRASQSSTTAEDIKPIAIRHASESEKWNRTAAIAAELRLEATIDDTELVVGQSGVTVDIEVVDFGAEDAGPKAEVKLETVPWFSIVEPEVQAFSPMEEFGSRRTAKKSLTFTLDPAQPSTLPHAENLFDARFFQPQITVVARVYIEGKPVELRESIYVDVAPPLTAAFLDRGYFVQPPGQLSDPSETVFRLAVTSHQEAETSDQLILSIDGDSESRSTSIDVTLSGDGQRRLFEMPLDLGRGLAAGDYTVRARLAKTGWDTTVPLRSVAVDVPKLNRGREVRVGVVETYDNTFVATLERLGVPHATIEPEDWNDAKLSQFTTIIVDMRAYLKRPDLVAHNDSLMRYVENGGTAIVMYQKTFDWKPEYAPYPIRVSRNRVTVEEAPIGILVPEHPLFTTPNAIESDVWENWIQERGLYFPSEWDEAYTPLIACSDPGEDIPAGSTLVADYGEGVYLYTALGWYRQLRELHPGCLRVFANMLAL